MKTQPQNPLHNNLKLMSLRIEVQGKAPGVYFGTLPYKNLVKQGNL